MSLPTRARDLYNWWFQRTVELFELLARNRALKVLYLVIHVVLAIKEGIDLFELLDHWVPVLLHLIHSLVIGPE